MALTMISLLVALLAAASAMPLQEEVCVPDASLFLKEFNAEKFMGMWYIDQHDTEKHVGKWRAGHVTFKHDHMVFADDHMESPIEGQLTEEGTTGHFTYSDETHTTEIHVVSTDYNTAIVYEVLTSHVGEDRTGQVGDSQLYVLSRVEEMGEVQREELYAHARELSAALCIHHANPEPEQLEPDTEHEGAEEAVFQEGSGEESGESSGEGSGDVMMVESSGEEGSGHEPEGSGESSGEEEHVCPMVLCMMYCEYGMVKDEHGCDTCVCVAKSCAAERDHINELITKGLESGMPLLGAVPPKCEEDGTYHPKQCHGSACYCVTPEGDEMDEFVHLAPWEAEHMTCACAIESYTQASHGEGHVSVHCDPIGNYEHVQCDKETCHCVNPESGSVVEGTELPLADRAMLVVKCGGSPKVPVVEEKVFPEPPMPPMKEELKPEGPKDEEIVHEIIEKLM